jgi:hypothetical protein
MSDMLTCEYVDCIVIRLERQDGIYLECPLCVLQSRVADLEEELENKEAGK